MNSSSEATLKSKFFYCVYEFVEQIDKNLNLVNEFHQKANFMDNDLFKARETAVDYFNKRYTTGPEVNPKYPFNEEYEENVPYASWYISINIIENYGEKNESTIVHTIYDNWDGDGRGIEFENKVLMSLVFERPFGLSGARKHFKLLPLKLDLKQISKERLLE